MCNWLLVTMCIPRTEKHGVARHLVPWGHSVVPVIVKYAWQSLLRNKHVKRTRLIFSTIIIFEFLYLSTGLGLDHLLPFQENFENFILESHSVYPNSCGKIINEGHKIAWTSQRCIFRTPNIGMNIIKDPFTND